MSSCSLPTPTASNYGSSQNGSNADRPSGGTLSLAARAARGIDLLPTPTASDLNPARLTYVRGNPTLSGAMCRLPTPTTNPQAPNLNSNTKNGPTSLLVAARMLPTPLAMSARQAGARNNTRSGRTLTKGARTDPARDGNEGATLLEAVGRSRLPTPVARDHKGAGRDGQLPTEIGRLHAQGLLPTPRASDATKGPDSMPRERPQGATLPEEINRLRSRGLLPTPTATDARAGGPAGNWTAASGRHAGATLTDVAVRGVDTPTRSRSSENPLGSPSPTSPNPGASTGIGGGRLNPAFVEWMMGLPLGWTMIATPSSYTSSVTVSSSTRRRPRSPSSGTDSTAQISMILTTEDDHDR